MTPREILAMADRASPEGNAWFAELGLALRELEAPRAKASFRRSLRRSLLTASTAPSVARQRTNPLSFLRRPMLPRYVLAAGLVASLVASAGGTAAASTLPGEAVVVLKRAFENAELALTLGELERAGVLERHVERRLSELAHAVVAEPAAKPTATLAYEQAVLRFRAAVTALVAAERGEKHDAALAVAEAAAAKHLAVLEGLKQHVAGLSVEEDREERNEVRKQALREKKEHGKDRRRDDPSVRPERERETPGGGRRDERGSGNRREE
jgi:hypothetical protein